MLRDLWLRLAKNVTLGIDPGLGVDARAPLISCAP